MTQDEAIKILRKHLWLCDAAGRGNDGGSNLWRDAAAAIRMLVPQLQAVKPGVAE